MKFIIFASLIFSTLLSADSLPIGTRSLPIHERAKNLAEVKNSTHLTEESKYYNPNHQIIEVNKQEFTVTLEDGSVWSAGSSQNVLNVWRAGDKVRIYPGDLLGSPHQYIIANDDVSTFLFVNLAKISGEATLYIEKIDHKKHSIKLSNETQWQIEQNYWTLLEKFTEQDRIIIGNGKRSDNYFLINAEADFGVEATFQ